MRILRESRLDEYARHFWRRQIAKEDARDKDAVADIDNGGDPRWWLWKEYAYKLPRRENARVTMALLNQEEVEALLIHEYMVDDGWMQGHNLVPEPKTMVLRDLAATAISRRYFTNGCWDNSHHRYYRTWTEKQSLEHELMGDEIPLIESVGPSDYEIVDGWGRLLPFVTLLEQGYHFYPVESFVACIGGL